MNDRTTGLERLLDERRTRERDDVLRILNELRSAIERELAAGVGAEVQHVLFGEEKDQFERDRASLERRFAEIPGDIDREHAAIESRYADPTPRLFPVAVSWLFPRSAMS